MVELDVVEATYLNGTNLLPDGVSQKGEDGYHYKVGRWYTDDKNPKDLVSTISLLSFESNFKVMKSTF